MATIKYRYLRRFSVVGHRRDGAAWRDMIGEYPEYPDSYRPSRHAQWVSKDPWDDYLRPGIKEKSWKRQSNRPKQWKVKPIDGKKNSSSAGHSTSIMVRGRRAVVEDYPYDVELCRWFPLPNKYRVGTKFVRKSK
jgi:hypothetical protein